MIEHTEAVATPDGTAIEVRARRDARPVRRLCRLRHRPRRDAAAARHGDRLARDRHARGLRPCGGRRSIAARASACSRPATNSSRPAQPLRPAAIYDCNGPIVCAAVAENGGEPVFYGAFPDEEAALDAAIRRAFAECDMVILSGGTSKGAGDLTHRLVAPPRRARDRRPRRRAEARKAALPRGLRRQASRGAAGLPDLGDVHLPRHRRAGACAVSPACRRGPRRQVAATVPVRVASELGRTEFVMVSLVRARGRACRLSDRQGLGLGHRLRAGGRVLDGRGARGFARRPAPRPRSRSSRPHLRLPDLVIIGSHGIGLDAIVGRLAAAGSRRAAASRSAASAGSRRRGAASATSRRSTSSIRRPAPTTRRFLTPGLELVEGWRRMQGVVFRPGDARFEGRSATEAVAAALADPACLMVNRNPGAGTRILIDRLLGGRKARRLLEPAAIPQRRRGGGGAGARRLGRRDRAGGEGLRPRLPAARRGALRFRRRRRAPQPAGGGGVPRNAGRSGDARGAAALGFTPAGAE